MNWLTYSDTVGKTSKGRKAFVRAKVMTTAKPLTPSKPQAQPQPSTPSSTTTPTPSWTAEEDALLLSLSSKNSTWKAIHAAIPSHKLADTKRRLKTLRNNKGADPTTPTTPVTPTTPATSAKAEGSPSPKSTTTSAAASATDLPKSALKKAGSPKSAERRGVVFVEEVGELDATALAQLYKMHARADREKWIEISSRYFDKTGKRIQPGVLKDRMDGL